MGLSSHQSPHHGATNVWLTPPNIIEALGPFDLDPCASIDQPWITAETQWTEDDDGLSMDWFGFCWVNPPFGPEAETWLDRLATHGHGIGLVPARTETRWFVAQIWERAHSILFLHSRPHFHYPDGTRGKANSGAPICLIAYGGYAATRIGNSGLKGTLVNGWANR